MLHILLGDKGFGKSVVMTYYLYRAYLQHKTIYSNYSFTFKFKQMVMNEMNELKNCALAIDEAYLYADCRNSTSKQNIFIASLASQSRKRGVDMFINSQKIWKLDVRLRDEWEYKYHMMPYVLHDHHLKKATVEEIDNKKITHIKYCRLDKMGKYDSYRLNAKKYFNLYDSDEVIPITL